MPRRCLQYETSLMPHPVLHVLKWVPYLQPLNSCTNLKHKGAPASALLTPGPSREPHVPLQIQSGTPGALQTTLVCWYPHTQA